MCVKLPSGDLNPNPYPPHPTGIYICEVITTPRVNPYLTLYILIFFFFFFELVIEDNLIHLLNRNGYKILILY